MTLCGKMPTMYAVNEMYMARKNTKLQNKNSG